MSTHNVGFYEDLTKIIFELSSNIINNLCCGAILMSTHNIGFYEDLTKIIFELSSNIIKYAPYFFCCLRKQNFEILHNRNSYCYLYLSYFYCYY